MAKPSWSNMKAPAKKSTGPNSVGKKGKVIKSPNTVTRKGKPSFGAK